MYDRRMQGSDVLTSRQVCDEAGISYRQLDYWSRQGVLGDDNRDRGSGNKRRWTRRQAVTLAVVGRFVELGARPSELGELVAFLNDLPGDEWETTTLYVDPIAQTVTREPVGPAGQYLRLQGYDPGD